MNIPDPAADSIEADEQADEVAELDRRWAAIEAGEATFSNETVLRWIST